MPIVKISQADLACRLMEYFARAPRPLKDGEVVPANEALDHLASFSERGAEMVKVYSGAAEVAIKYIAECHGAQMVEIHEPEANATIQ